MRIHPINELPSTVILGRQSETGVTEVRLDCAEWLALWPELSISVWVTPPGGDGVYPAATHMEGDVLVWPVTDADTAVAGSGTMEVLGTADGQRKLSAITTTRILATTTLTQGEAPESAKPWVEQVLGAAEQIDEVLTSAKPNSQLVTDWSGNVTWVPRTADGSGGSGGSVVVQSVQPDLSQNNPDAPDYVKNRTHYTVEAFASPGTFPEPFVETVVTAADGGSLDRSYRYIRATSTVISPNELLLCEAKSRFMNLLREVTRDDIVAQTPYGYVVRHNHGDPQYFIAAIVALKAGYTFTDVYNAYNSGDVVTCPEPGVYLMVGVDGEPASNLSWNEYVYLLDEKYIPDGIARKSDIPSVDDFELPDFPTDEHIYGLVDHKLDVFGKTTVFSATGLPISGHQTLLHDPWAVEIGAGKTYAVFYNGEAYTYQAVIADATTGLVLIGNGQEYGMTDHNPGAPFAIVAWPNAMGAQAGMYGAVLVYDGSETVNITVYGADAGYYYYDGEKATLMSLNELRAAILAGGGATILAETTVSSEGGDMAIYTPPSSIPEVGETYTVTYNGTDYDCDALLFSEDSMSGVALGSTDVMGMPGGNPDAPFVLLLLSSGADIGDGIMLYGIVVDINGATSATLSVTEAGGSSEYMTREQVVELITEMMGQSGESTTDQTFYTADGSVFHTIDEAVFHVRKGDE